MSRNAKLFAANAITAAGLCWAALTLGPSAAAEPAVPPVVPNVPALGMLQQFATNPASIPAVLQTAATALNGASAVIGGPATGTLPVSPIPGAPATPPVADPTLAAPGMGTGLVPLLNELGVPANLINLAPSQLPFPLGNAPVAAPSVPLAPVAQPAAPVVPLLPPAPVGAPPSPLLSALP
jgi:hypothetical protein